MRHDDWLPPTGLGPLDLAMAVAHALLWMLPLGPALWWLGEALFGGLSGLRPLRIGLPGGVVAVLVVALALRQNKLGLARVWLSEEDRACVLVIAMACASLFFGAWAPDGLAPLLLPLGALLGGVLAGAALWPRPLLGSLVGLVAGLLEARTETSPKASRSHSSSPARREQVEHSWRDCDLRPTMLAATRASEAEAAFPAGPLGFMGGLLGLLGCLDSNWWLSPQAAFPTGVWLAGLEALGWIGAVATHALLELE